MVVVLEQTFLYKGQVLSVDLIDGGSGYTKAPKVIVARRFDILSEREIGVSIINLNILPPDIWKFWHDIISCNYRDQRLAGLTGITGIGSIVVRVHQIQIAVRQKFKLYT